VGGIAEFQVEVSTERALAELSVQIEPVPGEEPGTAIADRVAAALQRAFALRASVSCVPPGSLPRFEAKARRWIRR
ncbi:MAG: phenylacetate--CoA ligase family protein, partial [Bryobacteraceae bacterium]|nr:phenylacetate--CoA ligase family protein [Bryobacteraceae bacterium]